MEHAVATDLTPFLPRVATVWATEAPEAHWRALDGSLVFADISGFTALSERLATRGPIGAEELTEVLGECFTGLLAVAYGEGGSLLKFGGDALLLLFDGPGHEIRASRAAVGMRAAIRTVGRLTTSVGAVRLHMSQGVHTGEIHVFRVGASHKELLIAGPAATTVVEMEGVADAGEIVISRATAAALEKLAPELLGAEKAGGVLLRNRTLVHLVEGFPAPVPAGAAATEALPVALRSHLAAGGDDSEHRYVSISFVHFDGTDSLLRDGGPEAVAAALDELVVSVQAAVEAEDVTFLGTDIDKDGGKIILISGAPVACEDAEGRLLRAVRRIIDERGTLPVRAGVNRGHVFAGAIGPPYRRTYTVMGDAVNLSARLMAKAAPGEIVVAPTVLERSRTAFATTAMEPFMVKGKSAPVLARLLGAANGTQETRAVSHSELVGRERELGALRELIASGGATVVGDVGIGKTRLLEELRGDEAAPLRVVTCEQYARSTPYFSIQVLLRHVLGVRSSGPRGVTELHGKVDAVDAALLRWLPLLGDVLGVPVAETSATRRLQPQYRRERTREAVAAILGATLAPRSVVAFDDSQWMDDASRDVVAHLASAGGARTFSLVVTRRSDAPVIVPGLPELELSSLTGDHARELIATLTADDTIEPYRVDAIVERAAGNPLFIEELVRLAQRHGNDTFPGSIEAVIAAQIDGLPPADRRLLRCAAVLGESFEPALFAEVVANESLGSAGLIEERLKGLVRRTRDGRVQFRHRLVRDVAYGTLPFRQRHDLHARAAHVIERELGDKSTEAAEVLSLHCFHAQQFEKCWTYATAAGEKARNKYALVESIEHYERAIAAARKVSGDVPPHDLAATFFSLGEVRHLNGQYVEAEGAYRHARSLWKDDPPRLADVCGRQAQIANRLGRGNAVRWLMRGLRHLADDGSVEAGIERGHLMASIAWARLQSGKPAEAVRWCRDAITEAERWENRAAMAQAYAILDHAYMALGQPDNAIYGTKALALYRELEQDHALATQLLNLGARSYLQGRWTEALELYRESREKFLEMGDYTDAAMSSCNIGEVYTDQGHLDDALRSIEGGLALWRSLGFAYGVAVATRYKARVALRQGLAREAKALFVEARATFAEYGLATKLAEVDTWMAECCLAVGETREARALLDGALATERESGATDNRAMIHRLRAYLAAAEGDIDSATAEIHESLVIARSRRSAFDVLLAHQATETLARLGGHPLEEDARREQEQIVEALGVAAKPPSPLPSLV